ncbi:hypothetical protein ADIAG_03984 [Paeniglutamicibacter gangotriensis Lz1y]|uniref:Uncharacterized protein n=1 Tax=Paeniglutamicibacter gangotriensis Lz1y TaxID=1276920 RepID=M7NDS5_9MICC|nr:hypothetical protein ADIAG_03984 [Paeniglutamicibacter gangotriensis Lz1y]
MPHRCPGPCPCPVPGPTRGTTLAATCRAHGVPGHRLGAGGAIRASGRGLRRIEPVFARCPRVRPQASRYCAGICGPSVQRAGTGAQGARAPRGSHTVTGDDEGARPDGFGRRRRRGAKPVLPGGSRRHPAGRVQLPQQQTTRRDGRRGRPASPDTPTAHFAAESSTPPRRPLRRSPLGGRARPGRGCQGFSPPGSRNSTPWPAAMADLVRVPAALS